MNPFARMARPSFGASVRPGMPAPLRGKALRRRMVQFREAAELLPYLPAAPGEATHAVMTGRYDLMILLSAVLESYGVTCRHLRIATLSFNGRNVSEIAHLLRVEPPGPVERVTLLCSTFFQEHNRAEFADAARTVAGFPGRWRLAAARSHAKVACVDLVDGRKLVLEGSANLRTNSNREQLTAVLDAELHDWHAAWIDELVNAHEHRPEPGAGGEEDAGE